ncbi:aminoalcoholphosphotransferase [Thecamonas trahens ATCC 50062]|uniref:Aminoalcoholphosphotransferase n=1 Tax=Thecamonas trahens ATCC 50062 TaxID=461836 RepID=A0A0L0DRQ5_THETB|nr:aminoalcoholphosphotransferase [Thecamonas trahens ATCC 50062]KNC54103.1 aminoalcoholphosphotransferase [Thecamonas trahens ATCC 50062]|eukprot:XP_013753926.1 aminoalcoholphosphotransferase [Thecamonas trahens ATCC 50062]
MAPNLVTLVGFAWPLVNFLLFIIYAPTLTEISSSPLGELFDHGCDAINASVTTLVVTALLRLGPTDPSALFMLTISCIMFFTATLEEYHTHTLALGVINGPTEGILIMIALAFSAAAFSTDIWLMPANEVFGTSFAILDGVLLNQLVVFAELPIALSTVFTNLSACVRKPKHGTVSAATLAANLFPCLYLFALAWAWFFFSPGRILASAPWITLTSIGLLSAYLVGRLITAHLLLMDFPVVHTALALPTLAVANSALAHFGLLPAPPVDELTAAYALLAASVILYTHFAHDVISGFTTHLGINVLSIPYPPKTK